MIAGVVLTLGFAGSFVAGYILYRAGAMTAGTVFLLVYYVNLLSRPIRELPPPASTKPVASMRE